MSVNIDTFRDEDSYVLDFFNGRTLQSRSVMLSNDEYQALVKRIKDDPGPELPDREPTNQELMDIEFDAIVENLELDEKLTEAKRDLLDTEDELYGSRRLIERLVGIIEDLTVKAAV